MTRFRSVPIGACFLENGIVFKKTSSMRKVRSGHTSAILQSPDARVELLSVGVFVARYDTHWVNKQGQRHRSDGPAVIHNDGSKEWWVNGVQVTDPLTILLINTSKEVML